MFETHDSGRIVTPLGLSDEDSHLWSYAMLRIHVPWFYMIYKTDLSEDGYKSDILLLSNIKDLISASNYDDIEIEQVYLISPAHINNSNDWKMEPIKEILCGIEPKYNQSGYVYVVKNGNRYLDASLISNEEELMNIITVFMN